MFRIVIWFFFLFVYSQAGEYHEMFSSYVGTQSGNRTVREPLDKVNKEHKDLDLFEIILYVMGLSFAIEGKSHSTYHSRVRS